MPELNATVTSNQVVEAFVEQVQGRTFVITGAVATIQEIDPSVKVTFVQVDLSDHDSVRRAANKILEATASKVDVLINSAGNMGIKEYTLDKQGIEVQLSGNHIGHFLLTNMLVPALLAAAAADHKGRGARVVNLSSLGYLISPFRFHDYNFSGGKTYDLWTAHGQAKTANILFSFGLTKRLVERGVTSFAAHPGSNLDTQLGSHLVLGDYNDIFNITERNAGKKFLFDEPRFKKFAQIGATPLAAALDPDLAAKAPGYLQNCQLVKPAEHARDHESVEELWKLSEILVGQEFSY